MAQELLSCFVSVKESLFCGLIDLLLQPESAVRNSVLSSLSQYIFFYDYEIKFADVSFKAVLNCTGVHNPVLNMQANSYFSEVLSSLAVWANAQICSLLVSEFTISLTEMIKLQPFHEFSWLFHPESPTASAGTLIHLAELHKPTNSKRISRTRCIFRYCYSKWPNSASCISLI